MVRIRRTNKPASAEVAGTPGSWPVGLAGAAIATKLTKISLWALVACGPLGVVLAMSDRGGGAVRAPGAQPRSAIGPVGFAELYVAAYLAGRDLRQFFPDVPAPDGIAQKHAPVVDTAVTSATEVRPGYWSITVADGTGRFFRVPIAATGDAAAGGADLTNGRVGYVATALPAQVAGPSTARRPDLAYPAQVNPLTPLGGTVTQFMTTYLTGVGELSRYLSPSAVVAPIAQAPYKSVGVTSLSAARELPDAVPVDGTRTHVLAGVEATSADTRSWPLTYALTLTARAGRWEVTSLDEAPALTSPKEAP